MFAGKNSMFDKLLDKGANQYLLEPDWGANLAICDSIRQGDVTPKYAVQSLKKKISSDNPHVSKFALQILETCVKNCGSSMHDEVCTQEFMMFMENQLGTPDDTVKEKILELIRIWSHAFRNQLKYKVVTQTYNALKDEGFKFPPLRESDAMFTSESAPDWKDGEKCHRCRVQFSTFKRKHHCRSCGNIFCNDCSSKRSIIPRFGIEREVRVCDSCYDQINKIGGSAADGSKTDKDGELPSEYLNSTLSKEPQVEQPDRDRQKELELQEKEELELALALSASEAETSKTGGRSTTNSSGPPVASTGTTGQAGKPAQSFSQLDVSEMDPELARYLNRNYWEKKVQQNTAVSMPNPAASPAPSVASSIVQLPSAPPALSPESVVTQEINPTEAEKQQEDFLNALRSSVEIFVNRMKSNSIRGRSIANDSSVQTLFLTLNAMHPQLLEFIKQQEDARTQYETLQDKLAQMKDAREALNALRDEHAERRRREAEEVARQRQIQMRQKLEVMRQKKQELLDYQRQVALQRLHEQEMERKMRLEQEKHMLQVRQYQQQFPYSYSQQQTVYPGAPPPPSGSGPPQQFPQTMGNFQGMYPGQEMSGTHVPAGAPDMVPPGQYGMPNMTPQSQPYNIPSHTQPQSVDYAQAPYNMQGMNQALPDYSNQVMPGGPPGQPTMSPPQGAPAQGPPAAMMPGGYPQQYQSQGVHQSNMPPGPPPIGQQVQQPPATDQLINFD